MAVLRSRLVEKRSARRMKAASDAEIVDWVGVIGARRFGLIILPQDRITDHRVHYSRSNAGGDGWR